MNRKYRKTIIAGNWKMNKTPTETKAFMTEFKACLLYTSQPRKHSRKQQTEKLFQDVSLLPAGKMTKRSVSP